MRGEAARERRQVYCIVLQPAPPTPMHLPHLNYRNNSVACPASDLQGVHRGCVSNSVEFMTVYFRVSTLAGTGRRRPLGEGPYVNGTIADLETSQLLLMDNRPACCHLDNLLCKGHTARTGVLSGTVVLGQRVTAAPALHLIPKQ